MNEFVDIIVIYVVFRAILAFLGAWGGMETDATISDETDKGLVSIVLCTITDKVSDIFSLLFICFYSIFICRCKITANLEQYYPLYLRYHSGYLHKRR